MRAEKGLSGPASSSRQVSQLASLPAWVEQIRVLYESGSTSQFIVYGNIYDGFLRTPTGPEGLCPLGEFIAQTLLQRFDVILSYDLGNGIRIEKGGDIFMSWPRMKASPSLPRTPLEAIDVLTHYFRYCSNLANLEPNRGGSKLQIACLIKDAHLLAPAGPGFSSFESSALVLLLREWANEHLLTEHPLSTFLLTENLNDLHSLLVNNPRAARVKVPLPAAEEIQSALESCTTSFPTALKNYASSPQVPARQLVGAQLVAIENLLKKKEFTKSMICDGDLAQLKKTLVENDCNGLIEFIESSKTLDDLHGQEKVKEWVRQDIALWRQNDLSALPMGYLLCGPVGTGKTFMVECLAGEATVPVVKLKNFRDKWVGSTEGNLEKIFRLLHALERCIVFIDEADQSLGKRESGTGDSGLSGRIYSMIAQEMSDTGNRGSILWVLASSRPDLIEVDLKRPGRIDVKIPLFPTSTPEESFQLLHALCKRRDVELPAAAFESLRANLPLLLTPGAAEALAIKIYRLTKTMQIDAANAAKCALTDYQPPVDPEVLKNQILLAVKEASDRSFVPPAFRSLSL